MWHLGLLFPLGFHPLSQRAVCLLWQESWKTLPSHLLFVFSSSLWTHASALLQCSIPLPISALLTFASSILPCSVGSISTPPIIRSPFHFLLSDRFCEQTMYDCFRVFFFCFLFCVVFLFGVARIGCVFFALIRRSFLEEEHCRRHHHHHHLHFLSVQRMDR
jgi:hypothetical protein